MISQHDPYFSILQLFHKNTASQVRRWQGGGAQTCGVEAIQDCSLGQGLSETGSGREGMRRASHPEVFPPHLQFEQSICPLK